MCRSCKGVMAHHVPECGAVISDGSESRLCIVNYSPFELD
jgi:hypothetical protein